MTDGGGFTLELSAEQVRAIVRKAAAEGRSRAAPDLATRAPALKRALARCSDRGFSQALVRGLLVLAMFPADGSLRGVSEIAAELDMQTSTIHRCVRTLVVADLLERDSETRRYRRSGTGFPLDGMASRQAESL